MAIEIPREINLDLGLGQRFFLQYFVPLPKPAVRLYGASANAAGHSFAKLVELSASSSNYKVLVELPRVQFCDSCDNEVEWTVDEDSVTIEGQIPPAAIFADKPITGNKRNRVQLCPTEPWAISFNFPGPVDWWTTSVNFTTDNFMHILVMKSNQEAETTTSGSTLSLPNSASSSTVFVPEAEPAASGSTILVPGPEGGSCPEGDALLTPSEIMDMVDGWFE